ncbi:ATP-binding protein [Demequina sp. NBRC 110055]|uniref:sensor histidine kinase n=1 Tax=Demequina sp. NBRC 110055 TaxID=1570344 RepID=UPI0009FD7615|nr:ATP-binding protein [Demequina sp. NBRC 110055]
MLQRLGIRGKILAVVAVPILVLVLGAGFIVSGSLQTWREARDAESVLSVLGSARLLENDFQDERLAGTNFTSAVQNGQDQREEAESLTDEAVTTLDETLNGIGSATSEDAEGASVDAEQIRADIAAAVQRTGNGIMESARAVSLGAPETDGGWLTFPADADVADMQAAYEQAAAAIDAIADGLPEDTGLDIPLAALAFRLGAESDAATTLFTEPLDFRRAYDVATGAVDGKVALLMQNRDLLAGNAENVEAIAALGEGQELMAALPDRRATVRDASANIGTLTNFYTTVIDGTVRSASSVALAMGDRDLAAGVSAYGDLDQLVENIRYEQVQIDRLLRVGEFLPGEAADARTMTARTDISLEDAQESSLAVDGSEEVPPFGASAGDGLGESSFESVRTQVLTGLDASLVRERDSEWDTQVSEELGVYEPLREDMWTAVTADAAAITQSAATQAILTALAALAIVIVSVIIALVIARRIIGPLRRLTTTATAVEQELPRLVERVAIPGEDVDFTEVQIPVESRDEVGRLAEAFNGVNAATLSIAAEQAALRGSISEMFVNVARRDQVLLNRQLSSIDEMERTEDDPNTLTKLFALDHLATRMRRNSESLLVLAGIDTGRRLRRPMPLSDVIRTASSEIELYERIDLELDVDPEMLGHMALTAAHLFAELLENATVFSDPGTRVAVRTGETELGYVVEIEDGGIGMTESEVAEANARVGSTAASEILGEQRLGLFVVGRIARRVGAQVEIRSQEGRGTLAVVSLPSSLFAGGAESPSPLPAAGGVSMAVDEGADDAAAGSPVTVAEVSATAAEREIAAGPAYAPAALQAGESLAGRTGDLPARAGAPADEAPALPSRGGALPTRGETESIESLIAADAEAAPSAEATDPGALTDGTSQAGLPTRRRRSADVPAPEATPGITPVVGLPARATDAQLSALDAETDAGFTPSVAPAEVAPQSAEERASVFRGFRSRRETEQAASESLGQSARREGVALPPDDEGFGAAGAAAPAFEIPGLVDDEPQAEVVSADAVETPPAIPGFADDDAVDPGEFAHEQDPGTSHGASAAGLAGASAFGAAAFFAARSQSAPEPARDAAAEPVLEHGPDGADPYAEPAPTTEPAVPTYALEPDEDTGTAGFRLPKFDPATTGQIPVIEDEIAQPAFTAPAEPSPVPALEEPQEAWTLPSLEQDEDVPSIDTVDPADAQDADVARAEDVRDLAPEPAEEDYPTPAWASVAGGATFGTAAVAAAGHGNEPADAEQERFAPVEPAGVDKVSLDDDAAPGHGAPPHAMPVEAAASAPAPQLDDLIQSAVEDDHRPGFFARLFGRGRKDGAAATAADRSAPALGTPEAPVSNPVAPPTFAPVSSVPSAPSAPVAPTPTDGARFGAFVPEQETPRFDAPEAFAPQPVAWEAVAPAPEPPAEEATHAPSAEAAAWEAAMGDTAAAAASATPERGSLFGDPGALGAPVTQEEAPAAPQAAPAAFTPQSFAPEPEQAPEPAESWAPAGGYVPQATAFAPEPEEPAAATPGEQHYTPEELATAHGWEAAGASALQAAEPEQTTSYQPIIQPEPRDGDDMDYASAAFSELSSLASERPKIEKTRAGLQKRRASDAPPVEVKKLDEEVEVAPAQRDADAVRSRFSAFYSGTQRARQDAEEFDRATQIEENAGGQD